MASLRIHLFLSFDSPKERNKEKATTKTNPKLSFYPQMANPWVPRNLWFALFVDVSRTILTFISQDKISFRSRAWTSTKRANRKFCGTQGLAICG